MHTDLVSHLAQHRTLGAAPPEELAWLAAHGKLRTIARGELIARKNDAFTTLVVLLSGQFAIRVDRGAGPRKVMDWGPGDVTGLLPYSRMVKTPADVFVDEPGEIFEVDRRHFTEMTRECPTITTLLVHAMIDRARRFTSSDLQDEKMLSLGRLTAGLAHELNNPASAAARSAKLLTGTLVEAEAAVRRLVEAGLGPNELATIDRVRQTCVAVRSTPLTPIERSDREEALSGWLESHGIGGDVAAFLVDAVISIDDLDRLSSTLDGDTLDAAVRWVSAGCSSRALASEIENAASRMQNLVAALKRHTYMDRATAPEAIDLEPGLRDSVTLLMHKARHKSIALSVLVEPNLPRVLAIGGDVNQIWMNLIDNALDAAGDSGEVSVTAARHLDTVVVRIIDNGPGIPPELRERIFDPFFTTKPVGQGTGLGLDIARRLARRNNGDIEIDSRPRRTEFRVTLPIDEKPER